MKPTSKRFLSNLDVQTRIEVRPAYIAEETNRQERRVAELQYFRQHYNANGKPKIAYPSEWGAVLAAARISREDGRGQPDWYQCPICNDWHTGTYRRRDSTWFKR
jgi:hypothetical protein